MYECLLKSHSLFGNPTHPELCCTINDPDHCHAPMPCYYSQISKTSASLNHIKSTSFKGYFYSHYAHYHSTMSNKK